ncbi:MAG: hypothetical protein NTY38_14125 [Acidobacteria bacterium]|nr:hypothetical protein [Acidobacteriota bacterium]
MLKIVLFPLLLALLSLTAPGAEKKVYPQRWVYVSRALTADSHVAEIREIARTASEHGLTAIVLAAGLDKIDIQPPAYLARLKQVKQICDQYHLEIIPTGFNVGYGGSLLAHNPNLAAGMPVKGALFVAGTASATFHPELSLSLPPVPLATVPGDAEESPTVLREVEVRPGRCYRLRFSVETEGYAGDGQLSIRADTADHRNLCPFERTLPAKAAAPTEFFAGFNSWYAGKVTLSAGISGQHGKVRLTNVKLEEVGLINVIRRPGTPVVVRGEKNGQVYTEGQDFAPIADPTLNFEWNHQGPAIRLLKNTRIRPGERLRVDYYHGTTIYRDQVSACISEPRVMPIWRRQFPLIQKYIAPKTYLLALDEVRLQGHCEDCRKRNLPMARMIGDYATELYNMVREFSPGAESYVWSDMFDNGSFVDSWKYLPKDMHVAAWYYEKRQPSLAFFSSHGFKTLAGAYYDADDLKNPQGWLESLDETPGAQGIMYTTWSNKYKLLAAFGDLVTKRP